MVLVLCWHLARYHLSLSLSLSLSLGSVLLPVVLSTYGDMEGLACCYLERVEGGGGETA